MVVTQVGTKVVNRVSFPLAKFTHMVRILAAIREECDKNGGTSSITIDDLSKKLGLGKSLLTNNIPALRNLKLIGSIGRRYLFITHKGRELLDAIESNNIEKIREIGLSLIRDWPVLNYAYQILKENPKIKPDELGWKLAEKFGKRWDHVGTYGAVGRSCIDILKGFYLVEYDKVSRNDYFSNREDVLKPYASANVIVEILRQIDDTVSIPNEYINTVKKIDQFKALIDLKLVKQVGKNAFELTDLGAKLKMAIEHGDPSSIFRQALFSHNASRVAISKLREIREFNWEIVANLIEEINNESYAVNTKRDYAKKFLTWLRFADLVEEVPDRRGWYRMKDNVEVKAGNNSSSEDAKAIEEFKSSDYDIMIWKGRIFVKFTSKIKVDGKNAVEVLDYTNKIEEQELNASVKFTRAGEKVFLRVLKDN